MRRLGALLVALGAALLWSAEWRAAVADEFKLKRRGPFEFTEKPGVIRQGDRITISFASQRPCDATRQHETGPGNCRRVQG